MKFEFSLLYKVWEETEETTGYYMFLIKVITEVPIINNSQIYESFNSFIFLLF